MVGSRSGGEGGEGCVVGAVGEGRGGNVGGGQGGDAGVLGMGLGFESGWECSGGEGETEADGAGAGRLG